MKTYKIAHAKKLSSGWDLEFSSHGEFFTELNEAQAESDFKNKKLMQSYADGNGMNLQEFIDSGRANEIEEYYHVIEVAQEIAEQIKAKADANTDAVRGREIPVLIGLRALPDDCNFFGFGFGGGGGGLWCRPHGHEDMGVLLDSGDAGGAEPVGVVEGPSF